MVLSSDADRKASVLGDMHTATTWSRWPLKYRRYLHTHPTVVAAPKRHSHVATTSPRV